ncbi:MAG: hypothetical protein Q9214_003877 [Letrouitia sp. 1 TL-2023]
MCLDEVGKSEKFIFEGEVLDFLSRFLAERRRIDIPFSERYGLIIFLENALEQCCFDWYKKWASEELDLAGIEAADDLDLEAWGYFIERLMERRRADPKILSEEAVTFDAADGLFYGAQDIRHDAVHRRKYFPTHIHRAVRIACALRDRRLVSQIESVLRVLHYRHSGSEEDTSMITPADEAIADSALQILPTTVKTTHQLLVKLENLLENALFSFAKRHALSSIDWDIAEEKELRDYDEQLRDYAAGLGEKGVLLDDKTGSIFRDCLRSARELRNGAAHREHLTPRRCRQHIEVAKRLAAIIQDDSLAATVEEVSASFMPLQDAIWACRCISTKTLEDYKRLCARTNPEEYHWISTARGNGSKKMLAGFYYRANWTHQDLADHQLPENLRQKSAWESFDDGVGSSLPAGCLAEN